MRYWIEKGAERAGRELGPLDVEALDLLDSLLADRSLYAQLHLRPGEALFIDNRDIAHNRTPYEDYAGKSRHLVRMWLADELAA
jgi:alpha-ketoglutarate-dependent taurine dioxygenase